MTINIGLKYNEGIILLADGRSILDDGTICGEQLQKIFKIWNNASIACNGEVSGIRKVEDLIRFAEITDNHFKKILKNKGKVYKLPANLIADIIVNQDTKIEDEPDNTTLNKILFNYGEEIFPKESLRAYKHDFYKNHTIFDVNSIAHRFFELSEGYVNGLVAGYDTKGPRIINVSYGNIKETNYSASGNKEDIAINYLEDYHDKIQEFKQALELAIFCGVKTSKKSWGVNHNFMAIKIEKKDDKISNRKISKKTIDRIAKIYSKRNGSFEPLSI